MKAIGFAYGRLYGCTAGPYSVVICAPDIKTARQAFIIWLENTHGEGNYHDSVKLKSARTLGNRPLLWAQVDVTAT